MTMNRRNWVRGVYAAGAPTDAAPLWVELSDEEAFGLSKFCRWVSTELEVNANSPINAADLLLTDTEPRIVCFRDSDGDLQSSRLLTSPAVVSQLLAVAADPDAPMFTGCRRFAMQYRDQLAACSGLLLTVLYWPSEQSGSMAPINPISPCSMPA